VKAIELAKLEAARIVVVFAYEIPAAYGGETGDYRRAVRELAEEATAKAVPRLEEAGVEYAVELVPERPADGLVAVAEQTGARHDRRRHERRAPDQGGRAGLRRSQAAPRLARAGTRRPEPRVSVAMASVGEAMTDDQRQSIALEYLTAFDNAGVTQS